MEKNLKERIEKECFVTNQCVLIDDMVEFVNQELDKAREEGFKDGVELEQLLNAEFFEEDYQDPKRLKELEGKYKLSKLKE